MLLSRVGFVLFGLCWGVDGFASSIKRKVFSKSPSFLKVAQSADAVTSVAEDGAMKKRKISHRLPFKNIMAANRAEIAVRIMRAATELNAGTVAIYCQEDRFSQHRWGADRSYLLTPKSSTSTPISTYLDIPQIIQIAKDTNVDAIHPGYGFLSESPEFASACAEAGITFVGPTVENLNTFSDKTSARAAAIAAGVPVVPGSDGALETAEEVTAFVEEIGLPVILKVRVWRVSTPWNANILNLAYRLPWEEVGRECVL